MLSNKAQGLRIRAQTTGGAFEGLGTSATAPSEALARPSWGSRVPGGRPPPPSHPRPGAAHSSGWRSFRQSSARPSVGLSSLALSKAVAPFIPEASALFGAGPRSASSCYANEGGGGWGGQALTKAESLHSKPARPFLRARQARRPGAVPSGAQAAQAPIAGRGVRAETSCRLLEVMARDLPAPSRRFS